MQPMREPLQTTESIRSTNRLPDGRTVPRLGFRQITPCPDARSTAYWPWSCCVSVISESALVSRCFSGSDRKR